LFAIPSVHSIELYILIQVDRERMRKEEGRYRVRNYECLSRVMWVRVYLKNESYYFLYPIVFFPDIRNYSRMDCIFLHSNILNSYDMINK
jgi:hypothetical protein